MFKKKSAPIVAPIELDAQIAVAPAPKVTVSFDQTATVMAEDGVSAADLIAALQQVRGYTLRSSYRYDRLMDHGFRARTSFNFGVEPTSGH
jgi:hypothetical protein